MTKKEYIEIHIEEFTIQRRQLVTHSNNLANDAKILVQDIFKDSVNRTFGELKYHLGILYERARRTELQIESVDKILTTYNIMIKDMKND